MGVIRGGGKVLIADGEERLCRFCRKDKSETSFSNESHAIPECLGNHQLILLDECDSCNKFFSEKLEDHLDKFTKPFRVAGQISGKKGIPNYRTNNKKNRIEFNDFPTIKSQIDEEFFVVDHERKEITVKLHQEPHIPLAVYKATLKIALSIIKERTEIDAFRHTIDWLLSPDLTLSVIKPAILMHAFVPGPRPTNGVAVSLFRRKADVSDVPYSIFVIAFGNAVFQLIVPSHIDDGRTISCKIPFFPSPFEFIGWSYGDLKFSSSDLSGTQKVSKEFPIVYSFDKIVEADPQTGEPC
ncbi:HNH endonuclease [Halomonas tibetensis]|uniref:HNH endonuclease n=1 Tax=Halomonas tibetensis TaxID=2259590 RepID=A0ABV7B6M4_9GAMM